MAPASKPTIYAHFEGKEALFEAVVARVIAGLTNFRGFEPGYPKSRTSSQVSAPRSWNDLSRRRSVSPV